MNALIFTAICGVVMMLAGVFVKSKTTPKWLALAGILLVFAVNYFELKDDQAFFAVDTKDMFHFNSFNLNFLAIIFGCTIFYFLLSGDEVDKVGSNVSEYFALIFFSLCGVVICATFNTLLTLFLGIEILSIPLYILTGSDKRNLKSNEAALKYFLMGAFSTGIMLLGIAFIYGGNTLGSMNITNLELGAGKLPILIAAGLVFLMIAMSFKVSAAPFHFWTPDVYDGAPTVFTSFMSTIVKAAGFFAFVRLFENSFGGVQQQWHTLLAIIISATLLIGNITAVFQQSVKRMMAYSSIAQAGFMLFAVFAINDKAKDGLMMYTAAYSLATMGLFAILTKMEDYTVDGFNGLVKSEPVLAVCAGVFLISLTGIPLTAGFQSKFFMLMAALQKENFMWLVILAVICAAIGAYYYFRVLQAMFFKEGPGQVNQPIGHFFKIMLIITAAVIILLGVVPYIIIW